MYRASPHPPGVGWGRAMRGSRPQLIGDPLALLPAPTIPDALALRALFGLRPTLQSF
jgi:hypothetical protein